MFGMKFSFSRGSRFYPLTDSSSKPQTGLIQATCNLRKASYASGTSTERLRVFIRASPWQILSSGFYLFALLRRAQTPFRLLTFFLPDFLVSRLHYSRMEQMPLGKNRSIRSVSLLSDILAPQVLSP